MQCRCSKRTKHSRINKLPDKHHSAPILRERNEIKSGSYCRASAKYTVCRGLTLIEVIASLMLVGSLLASVLLAHRRCARQTKLAVNRLAAVEVLDEFMTLWHRSDTESSEELKKVSGKAPGQNSFYWRKLVEDEATGKNLGITIMRIELFDPDFSSGEALASVELIVPASESLRGL